MFSFFTQNSINKISFEDLQYAIRYPEQFIIINTLSVNEQDCLIPNTVKYTNEEEIINNMISMYDLKSKHIIIYGKNANDESSEKKYQQIQKLGFLYVFLYSGGLFEWLLLQDIYGKEEFPTTTYTLDLLKYKHARTFNGRLQ
jgi:hypothetical protein